MVGMNFHRSIDMLFHDWHYDHPRILYALIRALKPKTVVEVGTYRGYAACWMAQALKENGKGRLYCIDDFSEGTQKKYDADHWRLNLKAMEVEAELLIGKSDEVAWPEQVDFVYIDGNHSLAYVEHDFVTAEEAGATVICLDDVGYVEGPARFMEQFHFHREWDRVELYSDHGLAVCIRKQDRPPIRARQHDDGRFETWD